MSEIIETASKLHAGSQRNVTAGTALLAHQWQSVSIETDNLELPMATPEIRELNINELDTVSGGYKFCWDGPAGTGTYPDYANCGDGQTMNDIIDGIVTNVRNIVYGPGK